MSDYYKCKHGSTLCGTCTRALKTQAEESFERIKSLEAERDNFEAALNLDNKRLYEDRDAWKNMAERLAEALWPFGREANSYTPTTDENLKLVLWEKDYQGGTALVFKDLKKAAVEYAAYTAQRGEGE